MITYCDEQNQIGFIPDKSYLNRITAEMGKHISQFGEKKLLIAIPDSANDLLEYWYPFVDSILLPIPKKSWCKRINLITKKQNIILIDDIICHGATLKQLISAVRNLHNIKLIVIYFHIVSKKICLYDIESKKFTLSAENKLYYIYFIEDKFMLKIPTLIYETQTFILMKSDIIKHGANCKFFYNGEKICRENVLKIM